MIALRKSRERGHADHGWLDTWHTFSFADYHDPRHMGFSVLRVINEDRIAPKGGFPAHPHRDMEIITYILEGALAHRDSLGNGAEIRAGEVQRMSAGTGIRHSEYNASGTDPVHLLQIWILPEKEGITPGYEQKRFADRDKRGGWRLLVSPDGRDGSMQIHQDAWLYATLLEKGEAVTHSLRPARKAYVHVARGAVFLNNHELHAGDGAGVSEEEELNLRSIGNSEALLFDLPG